MSKLTWSERWERWSYRRDLKRHLKSLSNKDLVELAESKYSTELEVELANNILNKRLIP